MSATTEKSTLQRVLEIARAETGTKEMQGKSTNPRILEYHQTTKLKAVSDEVAWAAAFVNWVLKQAGIEGTDSSLARSFLRWGSPLRSPVPGCIVILKRGPAPFGHVAFFVRRAQAGFIEALGGNQADQVKISAYRESDVLGYRVPDSTNEVKD